MFSKLQNLLITSLIIINLVISHKITKRHGDFRERFLQRKRDREIKDERMKILDKFTFRSTETVDDIVHYLNIPDGKDPTSKKIREMEKDFRRILSMKGLKYSYKRDLNWRTWRKVSINSNGTDKLISYKCNNPILKDVKGHCGTWTIEEEPPPCPYEFFSVINEHKLCGANYTQYTNINSSCPSVIAFTDLTATCDNPIETIWKISKLYGSTDTVDTTESVICAGKDYCEIFTSYEILSKQVTFRIINSTNDVIYSRIMKPNNTNYICVEDCGRFNIDTGKVTNYDIPLKLDLLSQGVNKRYNINSNENSVSETTALPSSDSKNTTESIARKAYEATINKAYIISLRKRKHKKVKPSMSKKGGKKKYKKLLSVNKNEFAKLYYLKNPQKPVVLSLGSILAKPVPVTKH